MNNEQTFDNGNFLICRKLPNSVFLSPRNDTFQATKQDKLSQNNDTRRNKWGKRSTNVIVF